MLGSPRLHLRETGSTSDRARELASAGAPHGTLVTAGAQTAGRGRQGRAWTTPSGSALLMSLVLRDVPGLLSLRAGVAVARASGASGAQIKWPNDVLVDGRKVAGILAEARAGEGWAVLGIGVNVAVDLADLAPELQASAGTLGRSPAEVEPFLALLLGELEAALSLDHPTLLGALRERDALLGRELSWGEDQRGRGTGIDDEGRLLVISDDGTTSALNAGEVHLRRAASER